SHFKARIDENPDPGLVGPACDLQRLSVRSAVRAGSAPTGVLRPIAGAARTPPAVCGAENRWIGDRARHAIDGRVHLAREFGKIKSTCQSARAARAKDHRLARRDA